MLPPCVSPAMWPCGIPFTLNRPIRDQDIGTALVLILRKVAPHVLITEVVFDLIAAPTLESTALVTLHLAHCNAPWRSISASEKGSGSW